MIFATSAAQSAYLLREGPDSVAFENRYVNFEHLCPRVLMCCKLYSIIRGRLFLPKKYDYKLWSCLTELFKCIFPKGWLPFCPLRNLSIGHKFITDIGRTISGITQNPKSISFIFQAISTAVQRDNVLCVHGA